MVKNSKKGEREEWERTTFDMKRSRIDPSFSYGRCLHAINIISSLVDRRQVLP